MVENTRRLFYIDGSCSNRKTGALSRVGGTAVVEIMEKSIVCNSYGPYPDVSSDRMEVMGLLHCLRNITNPKSYILIYCDNRYVVDGKMKGWYTRWVSEYRTYGDSTRANIDLWDQIWEEVKKLAEIGTFVEIRWVKGHSGNKYNELADKYADKGRKEGRITEIIDFF